jgi:hypothetical protein
MHARILKECRALAPMWGVALLLVVVPIVVWPVTRDSDSVLVFATFGFGLSVVLLSVASFGKEFAHGTYGLLLAQPVSRWLLWWEKTLVLGAALRSVVVVFVGAVLVFRQVQNPFTGPFADASAGQFLLVGLLVASAAYGGGLCLTLLLRQANGAFWLALFLPLTTGLGVNWVMDKLVADHDAALTWTLAVLGYSAVTYLLGLRLFLKREDVAWLTGDVTIPMAPAWLVRRAGQRQPGRRSGPTATILLKELHLQQVNFLFGLLLVPLFLGVVLAERTGARVIEDLKLAAVLRSFYFMLWALLPFLIGAASIVEERRLGLLEWQQSLPISRPRQYVVKLLVACGVSLILAALLPWLLEQTGVVWTLTTPLERTAFEWKMLLPLAVAVPLATLVGVFASSVTRNLLHALTLTVGLVAVSWLLVAGFALAFSPVLPLVAIIGLPVSFVVLWVLAFRNYCETALGVRLWLMNLGVLLAMFGVVFATSMGLYLRKWEVLLPDPTRISAAHVTGPAEAKIICRENWGQMLVLLPSGTLWQWRLEEGKTLAEPPARIGATGEWRDVATANIGMGLTRPAIAAIKTDGTLWWWGQEPPAQAEPGANMSREMMMRYGLLPPASDLGKGDGTTDKAELPAQTEPPAQAEPGAKMSREMMMRYGLLPPARDTGKGDGKTDSPTQPASDATPVRMQRYGLRTALPPPAATRPRDGAHADR